MIRIESSIYLDFERRILDVFTMVFFTKILYKLNFNDLIFLRAKIVSRCVVLPGIEFPKKVKNKLGLSNNIRP